MGQKKGDLIIIAADEMSSRRDLCGWEGFCSNFKDYTNRFYRARKPPGVISLVIIIELKMTSV